MATDLALGKRIMGWLSTSNPRNTGDGERGRTITLAALRPTSFAAMGRVAPGVPPANRPGVPPLIVTWADAGYLGEFRDDIETLRPQVDIVVASCHWGLGREPLQYMTDIAHTAIDAGADVVMGHGPHYPLPVEIYKGRPLFYGLGNLTFSAGHLGRRHAGWIGMLVEVMVEDGSTRCAKQQAWRDIQTRGRPRVGHAMTIPRLSMSPAGAQASASPTITVDAHLRRRRLAPRPHTAVSASRTPARQANQRPSPVSRLCCVAGCARCAQYRAHQF